jgi:hypothetical protein
MDDTASAADLTVERIDGGQFGLHKPALGLPSAFVRWEGDRTPGLAGCQDAAFAQEVADLEERRSPLAHRIRTALDCR